MKPRKPKQIKVWARPHSQGLSHIDPIEPGDIGTIVCTHWLERAGAVIPKDGTPVQLIVSIRNVGKSK